MKGEKGMARASAPGPDLERWAEEGRRTILDIADMLGVSAETYCGDPLSLVPVLQNYVSRLPLDQFEQSDWITLHTDLMAYTADFLIRKHGARWRVVDDPAAPRGYRYVIEAEGRDGETRTIDPTDVVRAEFSYPAVEITRMLASAELTLRLAPQEADN
ncbi:hypothetical protein MTQ13_10125 [Streptomyces sp. XM4011]|uniref:hypothetical protein n=1 Tax=Streptomyces sp. XM4011 TaxID=2929780 RepID=UPI001FF7820C|nr:hypothetical protein [Streptomyces sp. XM4011]MCK1814628.1 hypothetical protein [Streptomyces sp. XM4011]